MMKFLGFNKASWSFFFSSKSATSSPQVREDKKIPPSPEWHSEVGDASNKQSPPDAQSALFLYQPKHDYDFVENASVPQLKSENEVLLRTRVIGLNPIDWKGPAFNFGLPELPCISGRELVGVVVKTGATKSRFKPGDIVLAISTDYRDSRKGAFQEYSIAYDFNAARIPRHLDLNRCAPIGVGFVTAVMSLGICLGLDFSKMTESPGPDLLSIARSIPEAELPADTREETFRGIPLAERPKPGDWLAIWGASSTVGFLALQLAKLAGLRVICIVDAVKYGSLIVENGADVLVHRNNTGEAISIARAVTQDNLRFGLDAVGKETASLLQSILRSSEDENAPTSHLAGLTGLPKEHCPGVSHHKVPIKLFHERAEIGSIVSSWLEELLSANKLEPPKTLVHEGGLKGINDALQHLRSGECQAQRIVVPV